jgi:hypothetical protein
MRRLPRALSAPFPSLCQRYHLSWTITWRGPGVGAFPPPALAELIFTLANSCTIEIPLEIIEL